MDLNEFAQVVHALAVEKGFYDQAPTDAEIIAAIHSEVSEAFEEWRSGDLMVYHKCMIYGMMPCESNKDCNRSRSECFNSIPNRYDPKPYGIAVELIDVVLRILDVAAAWDLKLQDDYWVPYDPDITANCLRAVADEIVERYTLPELACELHRMTVELRHRREVEADDEILAADMSFMVGMVYTWLRIRDIDPEALLREKHAYNQTRPYRHGGKRF